VKSPLYPALIILLLVALFGTGLSAPTPVPKWEMPPGWTDTPGGDGGKTIRVTTLAAQGPGSLGEALAAEGPRVIEFAVGGIIDLGGHSLRLTQPYLTIAGETAPSPGITLTNGGVGVTTHDVIVRHLRIHPGAGKHAKGSGWEVDGLSTGKGAHDVIVDHCSLTWATDENLSASGPRFEGETPDDWRKNTSHRVTFSHCIIGEGLNASTHAKGPHSKGSLLHDNASDIAIIGNLYISNSDRNPLFKGGVRAAAVNNVICNPGERVMQFGQVPSQWKEHEPQRAALAMVGNVVRKGPSSAEEMAFFEVWPDYGPCDFFMDDNLFFDGAGKPLVVTAAGRDRTRLREGFSQGQTGGSGFEYRLAAYAPTSEMRRVDRAPVWPPRLKAKPAGETQAWVLENVGARPWERDATDRRLVAEAETGGGKIINFESEAPKSAAMPVKAP